MRAIKMKWFVILCGMMSGLLLLAAEEITDLQPGPHASLAGQILIIALPDGTTDAGSISAGMPGDSSSVQSKSKAR